MVWTFTIKKKKAARVARSKHRQNVKYGRIDTEKARRLGASGKWRICNSKHHLLPKPCLVTAQQEFIDNYSSLSNVEIRISKGLKTFFLFTFCQCSWFEEFMYRDRSPWYNKITSLFYFFCTKNYSSNLWGVGSDGEVYFS
jgi:hypothetical protein